MEKNKKIDTIKKFEKIFSEGYGVPYWVKTKEDLFTYTFHLFYRLTQQREKFNFLNKIINEKCPLSLDEEIKLDELSMAIDEAYKKIVDNPLKKKHEKIVNLGSFLT